MWSGVVCALLLWRMCISACFWVCSNIDDLRRAVDLLFCYSGFLVVTSVSGSVIVSACLSSTVCLFLFMSIWISVQSRGISRLYGQKQQISRWHKCLPAPFKHLLCFSLPKGTTGKKKPAVFVPCLCFFNAKTCKLNLIQTKNIELTSWTVFLSKLILMAIVTLLLSEKILNASSPKDFQSAKPCH